MPSEVKWGLSLLVGAGLISLGWKFPAVLVTLHVLVCIMLVLVVLLQSGKAADLAGAFGGAGSQTAFGPRGAATFLTKATTWCAIMFMVTTLSLVLLETSGRVSATGTGSVLEKTQKPAEQAPAPFGAQPAPVQGTPTAPAQQPTGSQPQQPAPAQPAPAPEKPAPAKSQPEPAKKQQQ